MVTFINDDLTEVNMNGFALIYVKEQTEELCLAAVKQNGSVLEFVKHQTKEICTAAVEQSSDAIYYVNVKKYPDVYIYHKLLWS